MLITYKRSRSGTKSVLFSCVIVVMVIVCSSCFRVKTDSTVYSAVIVNNSQVDIIIEHVSLKQSVTLVPCSEDSYLCEVGIINEEYDENEVLPALTKSEFRDKMSSLHVYRLTEDGEKLFYGSSPDYPKDLSNWDYSYNEHYFMGLITHGHRYIFRVEED